MAFGGAGKHKRGGRSGRGLQWKEFVGLIAIERLTVIKRRTDKQPIALAELYLREVHEPEATHPSMKVGVKVTSFFDLSRAPDASVPSDEWELTDLGRMGMERCKAFAGEVLGGEYALDEDGNPDPVTDEFIDEEVLSQLFGLADEFTGEELRGHLLRVESVNTGKISNAGNAIYNQFFSALAPEDSEAAVARLAQ